MVKYQVPIMINTFYYQANVPYRLNLLNYFVYILVLITSNNRFNYRMKYVSRIEIQFLNFNIIFTISITLYDRTRIQII